MSLSEREVKRSAKDGLVGRLGVLHFQGPKCVDQCCSQAFLAVTLGTVLLSSSLTQAGFGWNMWTLLQFAPTCMLLQFLLHVSFLALIILGHMIRCLITGICIFIFVHIARSQADIHMAIKFFLYIYIFTYTHIFTYIYICIYPRRMQVYCHKWSCCRSPQRKGESIIWLFSVVERSRWFLVYIFPCHLDVWGYTYIYIFIYIYL